MDLSARKNEILEKLHDFFEQNYEFIKAEGGHVITDYTKKMAFQQVQYYFLKNHPLIAKITEAEVKLTLPQQITPNIKTPYTIEGVIDIVQEEGQVWMYDLKSHDLESIKKNLDFYKNQLNIYAYIWKGLRGMDLDNTAVISTAIPRQLNGAIQFDRGEDIARELDNWNPVVPLGYSEEEVETIIEEFGEVVESIEGNSFSPPSLEKLLDKKPGDKVNFAVRVCRNCDARFSCDAFREYVNKNPGKNQTMQHYLEDYGTEVNTDDFIAENLDNTIANALGEE